MSNADPIDPRLLSVIDELETLAKARDDAWQVPRVEGQMLYHIALATGDPRIAIKLLDDANKALDTWIGHFDLGRAYLAAKLHTQADSEFDRCLTRRGEALTLFLDEEPTFAYLPPVYYYQGLTREGMQTEKFADSYRAYLAVRGNSTEDPLVREVRRRVSSN